MAGYCTIKGDQLWYDQAVEGLSDSAHRLLMYCFHGPGRTMLGVRRFTPQDALARIPAWTMETAQTALEELQGAGLVEYDTGTRLLFVTPYFEHSPVKGIKSISGAINALEGLPDSPVLAKPLEHVLEAIHQELGKSQKQHARQEMTDQAQALESRLAVVQSLQETNVEPLDKPIPEPTPNLQEQEQAHPISPRTESPEAKNASEPILDAPSMGHPEYESHPGWGIQGMRTTADAPSMGHPPRVRARPDPEPEPDPEPNPPLKPPPCARASPGKLELLGQGERQGRQRGRGKSKYGHLDQRRLSA